MANQKAVSLTIGIPGVEVAIWYNDANLKIGAVEWTIGPSGFVVRALVWDSNVGPNPVIDLTEGQGSGAINVPGNYRMVQVDDPDLGTYLDLPPNITWSFTIRSI